jgi:L-ascorbate metabolism protein UlaG (beta-lactamase superfamily)
MDAPMYLKQNVQLEPLIDRWYAWPFLIPPATAARTLTERHFQIMDSYISAPKLHAQAVRDPRLVGGPFIDYDDERVDEVRAFLEETKRKRSHMMDLSAAIFDIDSLLRAKAKGFSLAPLYEEIPKALRGYVELVYDLNNNPSFRIIEPLLYRSHHYDPSSQSLMLSLTKGDGRSYAFTTPRLEEKCAVHIQLPFDDEAVDKLLRLRYEPKPWGEINETLSLDNEQAETLHSFLTPEPPPKCEPYIGDGVRWRYFGHACVLIETKKTSLLFDPALSYAYPSDVSRYTYHDMPDSIDCVLLTHNHEDHVLFETLLQIRGKVKNIVVPRNAIGSLQDPSLKLILQKIGFTNVIELGDMESLRIGDVEIIGIPFFGEHSDLEVRAKIAYAVRTEKRSFFVAADSCNLESYLYDHVHRDLGDFDTLFIGMECDGAPMTWLYRPLLTQRLNREMDDSRRIVSSNYKQAMGLATRFNFREVYVYAMGQEPWLGHIRGSKLAPQSKPIIESDRLVEECHRHGIVSERLFGMKEMILE